MAADLFAVPVHVPASGEYVALGAARQAAATLAGSDLPEWDVRTEAVVEPDHAAREESAELRGRYADLRGRLHG
jgi:xylulokinase